MQKVEVAGIVEINLNMQDTYYLHPARQYDSLLYETFNISTRPGKLTKWVQC